jgi:hypothetical protein
LGGFTRFDPLAVDKNVRVANRGVSGEAGYVFFKINRNFFMARAFEVPQTCKEDDNGIEGEKIEDKLQREFHKLNFTTTTLTTQTGFSKISIERFYLIAASPHEKNETLKLGEKNLTSLL